jgi:hypothetical protein
MFIKIQWPTLNTTLFVCRHSYCLKLFHSNASSLTNCVSFCVGYWFYVYFVDSIGFVALNILLKLPISLALNN